MLKRRRHVLLVLLLVLPLSCGKTPSSPQNQAPTILDLTLSTPAPFATDQAIAIACNARDPDGDLLSYAWSSGTGTFLSDVTKSTVTWQAPHVPCQCAVTVTVSDGDLTATRSITIPVGGVPVPRFAIDPATGTRATTFTFDASGSEDLETPTNELEVRWNIDASWSPWTTDKVARHRFDNAGSKTITLAVRDGDGLVATRDSTIVVAAIPFEIENLGVRFEPLNPTTHYAGDFYFDPGLTKVFWEFGARVKDVQGQIKELPHVSYVVPGDASVVAIAEGEVVRVQYQAESNDYEVAVRSMNDPSYDVMYDHLINLSVGLGNRVQPGDVLGTPRAWVGWVVGSVEIMIVNRTTQLAYCPFAHFNASTRVAYQQKVVRLIGEWEEFKGDRTIYDEEAWVGPGCRYESMPAY